MKPWFTLLSLLTLAAAHGAEAPADGLYVFAPGTALPQVQSQDGKRWSLGAKQDLKVQDGKLSANGSANTRFVLDITIPNDPTVRENAYILVVAGTAYRGSDYVCPGERSCSLKFRILQDGNARQVASFLGVPISYSRHPGYRLQVSFTPAKPSFARGEDVNVTLRIVNAGNEPISFMNELGNGCPNVRGYLYAFSAFKDDQPVPDIGNRPPPAPCPVTISAPDIILRPAETYEDTVNLSKWFGFKEPGAYKVRGSYPLQFLDPQVRMKSIWEDYATGNFTITMD